MGNAGAPSNEASGTPSPPAPSVPVLHYPGFPGLPYRTESGPVTVVGTAEPGAVVTLYNGGTAVGQAVALSASEEEVNWDVFFMGTTRPSPDGRWLWYDDFSSHGLYDFETAAVTYPEECWSTVRWFPDGDRIACGYEDWMVGEYVLRTYRVSDGTVEDLATL
ncbi:MAG: hypothetical protein GY849_23140, partial [Deltaproteobacteria bacterium]|nr:hypothetical protein [Deltaproteobacteria bacterium]